MEGSAGEQNDGIVRYTAFGEGSAALPLCHRFTGSRHLFSDGCLLFGAGSWVPDGLHEVSPVEVAPCPCWAGPPAFPLSLRKWLCRKRHGRGWGALGHWCTKPQNRSFSKLPSQWGQRQMLCIISYPEGKVLLQVSFWRKKKKHPKRLERIQVFGSEHHKMRAREAQVRIPDLPFCKLCDLDQA